MTTRAFVGYVDGHLIQSTYSHYDGYPAGLGSVLANVYPTETQAREITGTHDVECRVSEGKIVPFTAYGEEGPMVAGWKDFVLEVA